MQPFTNLLMLGAVGGPISLSLSGSSRSVTTEGYGAATGTTAAVTATASGGSGSFVYSWVCSNGWAADSPNSATTTFTSPSISHGQTSTSTATLTVTSGGVTAQATVSLTHTRNLGALSWSISPAQQQVYGDGVPNAIVAGSWTISISGGSGSYAYSPAWSGDAFHSGGVSGNTLVCEMNVPFGTSKGGVWTLDVTDTVTGQELSVSRGMTFTNPSP